jgi:hypothetical protein
MWDRKIQATTQRKKLIGTADTETGRSNAGSDAHRQGNISARRLKNFNFQYFSYQEKIELEMLL